MEYDSANRFVRGENANGETTEYTYNGLGHRVNNTITRKNPNYAYRGRGNSSGSEHIGSVDDAILAWSEPSGYARFDASGMARQDEVSVESKDYVVDFTYSGIRDIFISIDGMYNQMRTTRSIILGGLYVFKKGDKLCLGKKYQSFSLAKLGTIP